MAAARAHKKLNQIVSQHTTQWFHRVGNDEFSPAIGVKILCDRILEYIEMRKLTLTINSYAFRTNICEFLCVYYVSKKRDSGFYGPFSDAPRPRGWSARHEREWQDFLRYEIFSADFWNGFWMSFPESLWELRVPGWRNSFEYVVVHYITVQPDKIDCTFDENVEGDEIAVVSTHSDDDV